MRRNKVTRNDNTIRRKLSLAMKYQRILGRVARDLGVSRQHVYMVAKSVATGTDDRRSPRIEAAILAEINKIERESAA